MTSAAAPDDKVLFQADPSNTAPVDLTHASTSSTEATIKMGNTKNVQFDGLSISNTGSGSSRVIYFTSGCGDITFTNNTITGTAQTNTTSTFYALIYGTSMAATGSFVFTGNTLVDGSNAAYMTAASSSKTQN